MSCDHSRGCKPIALKKLNIDSRIPRLRPYTTITFFGLGAAVLYADTPPKSTVELNNRTLSMLPAGPIMNCSVTSFPSSTIYQSRGKIGALDFARITCATWRSWFDG